MNILQILFLAAIAIFCVFKVASMCRETHEVQRWAFILLAVGAVWTIGCDLAFTPALWIPDKSVNRDLADLTLYLGVFLLCADVFISQLIREGKCPDRRNKPRQTQPVDEQGLQKAKVM